MYAYSDFDRAFLRARAAQFRDQLQRHLAGTLSEDEFRPLRLQNGWYVQRHAPMLRVAIPYGEVSSRQLRTLARVAREFDQPRAAVYERALAQQAALGTPHLPVGVAHLTTRQNVQFNWIALERAADVMDLLAQADLHGIQTSGNCIRNITSDALAGVAPDEDVDPRPYCELLRQWSTLHPEFAALPRKFKLAVTGAAEDRVALGWHDIGLRLKRDVAGQVGAEVCVGGGMGRTPLVAPRLSDFVPWAQLPAYLESIVRVYNRFGRRDNAYKARIKMLVQAQGEVFRQEVQDEFRRVCASGQADGFSTRDLERVLKHFEPPALILKGLNATNIESSSLIATPQEQAAYARWRSHNVHAHRLAGLCAVTLPCKRAGWAPGDLNAALLEAAADLADTFSAGEARISHEQNLVLPWVPVARLPELWQAARALRLAQPTRGLLTDLIACPGGDFCALANARSLPLAESLQRRYHDLDELEDLGPIDLHISGCINSCGHHHTGHIGVLGVDKDGREWYQVSLGGSDGSAASGPARAGKVIGPAFAASELPEVVEALLETYVAQRQPGERFIETLHRVGAAPFAAAANAQRQETRRSEPAAQIRQPQATGLVD